MTIRLLEMEKNNFSSQVETMTVKQRQKIMFVLSLAAIKITQQNKDSFKIVTEYHVRVYSFCAVRNNEQMCIDTKPLKRAHERM